MAFNAKESAEDNMRTSDVVYKDGQAYDPSYDNILNKQSDYGDDYENRPTLLGGLAKRFNDFRDKKSATKDAKKDAAKDGLRKGEDDASKDPNENGRGGDKDASLGEKEGNIEADTAEGKFKNAVQGLQDIKSGKLGKGSSKLKKAGPAFVVLAILFGFGGMSFLSGASLPESIMSQLEGRFDFSGITIKQRSQNWLRYQTSNGYIKNCTKAPKLFAHFGIGSDKTTFKPSKKMVKKLAAQGITFEDVDGVKVMKYKGETIVADKSDATNGRHFFDDYFNNNPDFQVAYTDGAITWRGSVAKWFDSQIEGFLGKIGVDRNLWKDFKAARDRAKSGDISNVEAVRKTIADYADSDSAEGTIKGTKTGETEEVDETTLEVKTDKDGNPIKKASVDGQETTNASLKRADAVGDSSGVKQKLTKIGNGIESLKKVSSAANAAVNLTCGVADFISAVSAIIWAYQTVQIIKTSSAVFEAFQKAKTGEAGASPYNEIARSMMEPSVSSYLQVLSTNANGDPLETKSVTRERSATQAESIYALYRGEAIDGNDLSVESFNINNVAKRAYAGVSKYLGTSTKSFDISAASFASCTAARIGSAAAGAAMDVLTLVGCIVGGGVSFGTVLLGCIAGMVGKDTAIQAIVGIVISTVVSFLVPFVANVLTRTIATEVLGEDLGNALMSGGNKIYGGQYQYSGGSVATKDTLAQFFQLQAFEKEEIARYERATRSPFDVSSEYTFLGSLATKMIPLASSMYSTSSFVRGLGDLVTNSISSLTPHSSAISAGIRASEEFESTKNNCPDVYYIGGVADAYCDPYFISDLSTIDTHPAEIIDQIENDDLKVDSDGNPVIQDKSALARYIIYCGQRSSPWGKADQNIMAQVTPSLDDKAGTNISIGDATVSPLSGVAGAVPIAGDILDVVEGTGKVENMGWITGASCVTGYEPGEKETNGVSWSKKEKIYQRFMEDQALAEAEGLGESAVSKFLAKYYEENPLDNSPEGILARYSGLTKENVIATLDALEALDFIADYDPSNSYPIIVEEKETIISLDTEKSYFNDAVALLPRNYCVNIRKEAYIS